MNCKPLSIISELTGTLSASRLNQAYAMAFDTVAVARTPGCSQQRKQAEDTNGMQESAQ